MDILAQVNWEETGTVLVAVIMALGGQKGLESLIVAWRGRAGSKNGSGAANGNGKYVSEQVCMVRHTEQEKLQNSRYQAIASALRELRDNVTRIHERIDDLANHRRGE